MAKLKTLCGIALSLFVSSVAFAESRAGSANPGSSSHGSQTAITGGASHYVPPAASTYNVPTYVAPAPDFVPAADPTATYGDSDDDEDADYIPPDDGPQYSDNSIASGFREQAARLDDAADDVDAARDDVAQAQADGDYDATMVQASGAAKVVESGADGAMALAGEVGGPEPVVQLYGQAKGAAGAFANAADGKDADAALEASKAIGETVGGDSVANRAANGAAAVYDAANGEWVKAAGEAASAAGDAYTGAMVQAEAGAVEGVHRWVEGGEERERIDQQAEAADERMQEQAAELRERAAALRETAANVDASTATQDDDTETSSVDDSPSDGDD